MSEIAAPGDSGDGLAYVLIAEDIESRIRSGELAPGTRLRSERDLAEFYGRSYGTVRKAIALLRDRGLVVTVHGRGNYTAKAPPASGPGGA
jgi:GntR family transcriptional regulator